MMSDLHTYLNKKQSKGNVMRMWDLLCRFMIVEKWASSKALMLLMNNPGRLTTQRFLKKMVEYKILIRDELYTDGHRAPFVIYRASSNGYGMMSPVGLSHGLTVVKKSNIAVSTLIHSIDLQCLHALCINEGYVNWQRPDYMFKEKGKHYSDAVAEKDKLICAFEIERYLKAPYRYQKVFEHYANEILEQKLDKVFYVCINEQMAKSIKSYFESIKEVKCGNKVYICNNKLWKRFSYVDYAYFGF